MKIYLAAVLTNNSLLCTGGLEQNISMRFKNLRNVFLMNIFLAGGISGNIREFWAYFCKYNDIETAMKVYIAGNNAKKKIITDKMNLYFAGSKSRPYCLESVDNLKNINILESFYYLRKNAEFMKIVPNLGSFLLDSGAFTFMNGAHKGAIDWDKYVEEYAAFINRYDVKLFFELDIDSIVGLKQVERLRNKLESLTEKKSIPVWHLNRGKQYFLDMCKNYPYVALGGLVAAGKGNRNLFKQYFPWFIKTAHEYGAKIHGLGFTEVKNLSRYRFDSVDSTAWLYGNRGGYLYKFNPQEGLMEQINRPENTCLKGRKAAVHNFNEWIKLSIYANRNW